MSTVDKLNSLLHATATSKADVARFMGLAPRSMWNRFHVGYFTADDLIIFAEVTGSKLLYELPDGQRIEFDSSDIRRKLKK